MKEKNNVVHIQQTNTAKSTLKKIKNILYENWEPSDYNYVNGGWWLPTSCYRQIKELLQNI